MTKEPGQEWDKGEQALCQQCVHYISRGGCSHRGRMLLQPSAFTSHAVARWILQFKKNKAEPRLPDSEESGGLSSREHMENEVAPRLDVAFESQEQSIQASLLGSELGRIIKMQKQILDDITRNFQKSKHVQKPQTLPLVVASTCL